MKTNWQTKKLGEVILDIKDGGTPSRLKPEYFGGNICWCIVKDIKPQIYDTKEKLTQEGLNHCSAKVWPMNSVIISLGATIGEIGIAKIPTATKQGLSGIVVNNKIITPEFLVYILTNKKEYIQKMATGATIKEVRPIKLKELLTFSFPPLVEQHRIVKVLDEVFGKLEIAKNNAEENLKNSKVLFESYLQGAFINSKYEYKPLGSVCEVIGGGTPSKTGSNFAKFYNGSIPWATVRDMKNEIITETEHKITKEAIKDSSTNIISKGNVIIATRVGLGKVCLIENDTAINQDLRGIVPINKDKLFVGYLFQWLKSVAHVIKKEGTGATVQGVKLPFIKSLLVPVPATLAEQKVIVKKLDELSEQTKKLEVIYKKKLDDLEEIKKSILKSAFNGDL
jgi:type I restriction enzyme S subunit